MITDQWKKLGRAITKNADELEQIYYHLEDELDLEQINSGWEFLVEHGLVFGNIHSGYSASSLLLQIGDILALAKQQQIQAPDLSEWVENNKRLIKRYHIAKSESDEVGLLSAKREIHTNVLVMQNTLEAEVRQLEYFVDNKFGHVSSLKAKQQENEYCIERASRSVKKLTLINDAEINRLCGDDFELMKIFHRRLLPSVKENRDRLLATIPRLKSILWEYRRTNQRTKLVQVMHNYLQVGRSISDELLSSQSLEVSPFNSVVALPLESSVDMADSAINTDLIDIVKSMRDKKYDIPDEESTEPNDGGLVDREDSKIEELPEPLLRPYLNEFIKAVKQNPQSARKFWLSESDQVVPVGIWIWWLHMVLQQSNDSRLSVRPQFEPASSFSANSIIGDLIVGYRVGEI